MSGLALAQKLIKRGHTVTVFERATQPGGLATYQDHGRFVFDRYYHVILPTDRSLIGFIKEIGLFDELRWKTTLTGFYVDRRTHSVSNALEFLKFPPLSLWGKARLAFTILYCSRIDDWRRLERIPVGDWLQRLSGKATYEKLWKPLLLAKLGENYRRVSAVFIWTYIKRMFSARDSSASREQMGHVAGGYKTVFDRLESIITSAGSRIHLGVTVDRIQPSEGRPGVDVVCGTDSRRFDKVVFTGPTGILGKVADERLIDVSESGSKVEYLGVLCMALVTKRPLTPFYVLNIADERIPFTGVIGMSNIVDTSETAGMHLTYLPKYVLSTDPQLDRPESEIRQEFVDGLKILFPEFEDDDIDSAAIHRARIVQPLQVLGYSDLMPRHTTRHPDFLVLNTAQFVNNTLNNNEVIHSVNAFYDRYGERFDTAPTANQDLAQPA